MDFFKIEMPRGADCARVDGRRDSRRTPGRARIAGRSIDGLTDDDGDGDDGRVPEDVGRTVRRDDVATKRDDG